MSRTKRIDTETLNNICKKFNGYVKLCFRCEHRARYLESYDSENPFKVRPRHECGLTDRSVSSCYLFTPVKPVLEVKTNIKDIRPAFPGLLGARVSGTAIAECDLNRVRRGNGWIMYWTPEKEKKAKKEARR